VRIPSPHPFLRTPSKLHFENILSERGRFLPTPLHGRASENLFIILFEKSSSFVQNTPPK
jgi:hypothetical protein